MVPKNTFTTTIIKTTASTTRFTINTITTFTHHYYFDLFYNYIYISTTTTITAFSILTTNDNANTELGFPLVACTLLSGSAAGFFATCDDVRQSPPAAF